ncbi:hypothetical protein [Streptomyces sp. BE133]|uniref:hypothetical protein n=1 Tax=Streptomyces sp. BE133 TaxID=3002523 RepID=UPI002E7947E8|nr:hypothetical protein [Streptomyces sp. BE133]MEE1808542.1 hypothetical protein [Streptomyces sp. BE133]
METQPSLVGAVATARVLGSIALLVGLVTSLTALMGGTAGLGGPVLAVLAVLLFGVPFAWVSVARRAWYRTRLEAATPAPQGSPVIARENTFEAVSRPLTVPVVIGLGLGVLIASTTGVPAGLALAGAGSGLLWQAQWLAREERKRGTWLLCPHAPLRPAPDDPALALYQQVPFYTAPAQLADARS